jgi:serine/threonine-protein kinase
MMGTPVYMSPEQCRGAGAVDHRSDIYSMGCVLYHMLTGRPPFDAEGMGDLIAMHLREQPKPPSHLVQGIGVVDELVLACLTKQPEQRIQTMADLQRGADAVMARITNSGASAQTVAIATPVPPGFRSEFPGGPAAPLQPATQVLATPTTLGAAAGEAGAGTMPPTRRRVGLFAGIGVVVVGGIIAAVVLAGGGEAKTESATAPVTPADAAAVTSVPIDAAVVTTAMPDAAVVAPPDAAVVVATPPDAGTTAVANPKEPKRPKKPNTTKPNTGSASGGNLYDNR